MHPLLRRTAIPVLLVGVALISPIAEGTGAASQVPRNAGRSQERRVSEFFAEWKGDIEQWNTEIIAQCPAGSCSPQGWRDLLEAGIFSVRLKMELEKLKGDPTLRLRALPATWRRLFDRTEQLLSAVIPQGQTAGTCMASGVGPCVSEVATFQDTLNELKTQVAKWKHRAPKRRGEPTQILPPDMQGRFCSPSQEGMTGSYLLTQLMCLRLDADGSRFVWMNRSTMRQQIDYDIVGFHCEVDRLGFVHAVGTLTNLRRAPETFWLRAQVVDSSNIRVGDGFDIIPTLAPGQAAAFSILMSRISTAGTCSMSQVSGSA